MLSKKANFSLTSYQLWILFNIIDDYIHEIEGAGCTIGLTESELLSIFCDLYEYCRDGGKLYFWVDDHEEQVE